MQEHDVASAHPSGHLVKIGLQRLVDHRMLALTQRATVAGLSVQQVVYALGDGEELRACVQHQPPGIHISATHVSEQGLEHLSDATASCRGVDVRDGAAIEQLSRMPAVC